MQQLTNSASTNSPRIITCPLDTQDVLDMAALEALLTSFKSPISTDNPSHTLSQAKQLASLLSSGPAITPKDPGRLLGPIEALCDPCQSPIIRSAGYDVITALCGNNSARNKRASGAADGPTSDSFLNTLERRKIWHALCSAGGEWFPETSITRLDALEALLGIGQQQEEDDGGEDRDTIATLTISANVEGLDGLLKEVSSWMASAVDSILLAHEEARQNPNSNGPSSSDSSSERTEEAFIKRLDGILAVVLRSHTIQLHEQDISDLLGLYSSWVDEVVRDELRAMHAHTALSVSIMSQQQVRAPPRIHGRTSSNATTPTTFTFPSSVVTPAEATLGVSRGTSTNYINAHSHVYHTNGTGPTSSLGLGGVEGSIKPPYTILGPLFVDLVERCLKQNVLMPTDTIPRVIKSLCYLLALAMRPIATPSSGAAVWDNVMDYPTSTPMRTRDSRDNGVRSGASSIIRQPRSSASASQSQETSANASPRISQRRALPVMNRDEAPEPVSSPLIAAQEPPPPSIDQRTMSLLESLLHDNWYATTTLQNIKHLLNPPAVTLMPKLENGISPSTFTLKPPSSSPHAAIIAQGALRALRFAILNALMAELAREQLNDWVAQSFAMGGAPTLYGHMDQQQLLDFSWKKVAGATGGGLGVRFEKLGAGLDEYVKAWRNIQGDVGGGASKDDVLMEFCALVTDVLGLSPKGEVGEVPRFAGELIQELALVVKDYRSNDGTIHRLRLSSNSNAFIAPTPLLNSITEILRLPLDTTITKPSLASILISLSDHLSDPDAVTVIEHLEARLELSPSIPDWAGTFRSLITGFCTNARTYPRARRLVTMQLQKIYSEITDIDGESLRAEIMDDMLDMWEKTLHEESNEDILNAAFDIMSSEIVLATMANAEADEQSEELAEKRVDWTSIADRIRRIWMKMAVTAPPYYEEDKISSLLSPVVPPGVTSYSAAPTPSAEPNHHRMLHSPGPSLPTNSLNPAQEQSANNIQANPISQPPPQASSTQGLSAPGRPGRAVMAATFLIKAFTKLAFRSPQSLTILLSDAGRRQSACAARMAIALFRNIVQLVGPDLDSKVKKSSNASIRSENILGERLQCPRARLVILQWLLRLRADRDHRIYAVGEIENEVLPLARMIRRAQRNKQANHVVQDNQPDTDLPSELQARRRKRAETKGAADIRMARNQERREGASRDHTREPRGRGFEEAFNTSASRSRSRPPASPQTPYTVPRPQEMLWSLPEKLTIELEWHATRPSPAMATFTSIRGEEGRYWLHVDYYVETLALLLEHERDWEVVSYVLCHLPLQLANKHFFCGPKSAIQIRKLVLVVCNAINEDRLSSNMDSLQPPEILQVDIQALLYHTLMVLISYHRLFDPSVGEYDQNAKSIKLSIVEVIVGGLARDEVTSRPCLEALSLAVYELTDQVAKFTDRIIEKLSRIMSNPHMAVHILELLIIIGYTPKLYSGSFREEDYQRVFAVAILYIEHHYRPDAKTLRTNDGRDSYALAQHVLNTAFFVIYIWFLAIKLEDRSRYVSFIVKRLVTANDKREVLEPTTEVCFDWLARYAYSNADPKAAPSFLYRSIVAPGAGSFDVNRSWEEQHQIELDNTSGVKAWKLGNSIVTISTMKKPPGWVRIVSRRPSGVTEMICRLENWPHVSPGDFAPDLVSMPVTMLADRPINYNDESLDVDEEMLQNLINEIVEQTDVIQDFEKPDPISGYVWSGVAPSQRRKEITIDPAYIALLLSSYPSGMMTRPSRFMDYTALKETLMAIDYTPVIDTHKVGVVYVAPGQTTEAQIFANQHGSPAYTRFLANLGRVIKPSNQLEVYTGGLRPETHGNYAYSWWDDMSQIVYHVATVMPNINRGLWKKQEIGNDGVKIVWNDSGVPFKFDTILSEYTLVNVVVEPHSVGARGAYSDNRHENEFFKVTLQTAPSLPRITPIGEFKIISAEKLSMALRHFTLQAALFCKAWEGTGMDGPKTFPLQTNWQGRLKFIKNSESKLPPRPSQETPNGAAYREGSRDFTQSY